MWPVPGLPPLGSFLARMRDRRRDVGRHVDFWKLFLLYLLISFVCRSWGCGYISGTAEVWRSKDNLKQSVFLLPWGPGVLRPPNLAASLTFIYSFSLECTWEVVTIFSGSLVWTLSRTHWALFWSITTLSQWVVLVLFPLSSVRRHWQ